MREVGVRCCGCGERPVTGTGLEGSRPSASGMNANENWADRRGRGSPVSEVGVQLVSGDAVSSGLSLAEPSSGVRRRGQRVDLNESQFAPDRLVKDFTRGVTCLSAGVSESRPQSSAV